MSAPTWVRITFAVLAALSFLEIYLGQMYPSAAWVIAGVVGAANAALATYGFAPPTSSPPVTQ